MFEFNTVNYTVQLSNNRDSYEVVNKETGVVEFEDTSLPRCIIVAEESQNFFDKRKAKQEKEVRGEVVALAPRQDRTE